MTDSSERCRSFVEEELRGMMEKGVVMDWAAQGDSIAWAKLAFGLVPRAQAPEKPHAPSPLLGYDSKYLGDAILNGGQARGRRPLEDRMSDSQIIVLNGRPHWGLSPTGSPAAWGETEGRLPVGRLLRPGAVLAAAWRPFIQSFMGATIMPVGRQGS